MTRGRPKPAGRDEDGLPVILAATRNAGKIREIEALLSPLGFRTTTLAALSLSVAEPAETGKTFEANAILKAKFYAQAAGLPALADDSGLCAAALGGAPGVASARYGGQNLDDAGRCLKLLSAIENSDDRRAWFECALALARPDVARTLVWEGRLDGRLAEAPRGAGGFGYDPIFSPLGSTLTLAQLQVEDKNALSHRAQAVRKMVADASRMTAFLKE
jgi:XTP/dITP diphosphohydrolase